MKKYIFIILLINLTSHAQQWQWAMDGQNIINPKIAAYNNAIYVSGTFHNSAQIKNVTLNVTDSVGGFICKIDQSGSVIWTRVFEASTLEVAGVKANPSGVYVAGSFKGTLSGNSINSSSQGDLDIFILKFNQQGNIQWTKSDGGAKTERMVSFDVDSTIIISGQFAKGAKLNNQPLTSQCSGLLNVFFAKYTLNGTNLWVKEIAGDSTTGAYVTQISYDTYNNPIFLGGGFNTMSYAGTDTGFCSACQPLLKFDTSGAFKSLLLYTQSGSGLYPSTRVLLDHRDNVYNLLPTGCNICHLGIEIDKNDKNGTPIYQKQVTNGIAYSTPGESYPHQLAVGNNEIFIAGKYKDTIAFTGKDTITGIGLFVSALDTSGNVKKVYTVPMTNFDTSKDINDMLCYNGDVYLTGTINFQTMFGNWILNSGNVSNTFFLSKLSTVAASVTENKIPADYLLFPNPTRGKLSVAGKSCIKIWNAQAEQIQFTRSGDEIDLSNQPKGIYFIEMSAGDRRLIKKIILD